VGETWNTLCFSSSLWSLLVPEEKQQPEAEEPARPLVRGSPNQNKNKLFEGSRTYCVS
jgi:hypothetical protein